MAHHVSPSRKWDSEGVCAAFEAIGLPAVVVAGNVRVHTAEESKRGFLFSLFHRMRCGYPPYHELRYLPERFVNNLEIHWNVDALVESDQIMEEIRDALISVGYPEVGADPRERDIAEQYDLVDLELDSTLAEIEGMRADRSESRQHEDWWPNWRMLNARMEQLCMARYSGQATS